MLKYYQNLKQEILNLNNKIDESKDESKKANLNFQFEEINLNFQLEKLKEKQAYLEKILLESFETDQIEELAQNLLSNEEYQLAKNTANEKNAEKMEKLNSLAIEPKNKAIRELNQIIKNNPDAEENETSKKQIQNLRQRISTYDEFIARESSKMEQFYQYLNPVSKEVVLIGLLQTLKKDNEKNSQLEEKMAKFIPTLELKSGRYPLKERINELKKDSNLNLALYDFLEQEEALINELTCITDFNVIHKLETHTTNKVEKKITEILKDEFVLAAKTKKISDITTSDAEFNRNVYRSHENYARLKSSINELKVEEENKNNIKKALLKMQELGFLDEHASANESGNKNYGFTKFLKAKEDFIDTMNENPIDFNKVKAKFDQLKEEKNRIDEMYRFIENTLDVKNYITMPTNIDSFRNGYVLGEHKQNLIVNAKFNSLYVMLSFIKENNLTIDEFINNPVKASNDAINNKFESIINKINLNSKNKLEAIQFLGSKKDPGMVIDMYKYSRCFELLSTSEQGLDNKQDNLITTAAINVFNGNTNHYLHTIRDYFKGNNKETLQNIFLATPVEGKIDYVDCFVSNEKYQSDERTGLIEENVEFAFEKVAFCDNFQERFYEAIDIIVQYNETIKNYPNPASATPKIKEMLEALQELSLKFMLTHDLKGKDNYSHQFTADVKNMVRNYKEISSLSEIDVELEQTHQRNLNEVLNRKSKLVKSFEKSMYESQKNKEKEFIKNFKKVNKEIDRLEAIGDYVSTHLEKGKTNSDLEKILLLENNQLKLLRTHQNQRLQQLREDYEAGKITEYYFEKRSTQIKLLENLEETPKMFRCDDKDYKNFKTYMKKVKNINIKNLHRDEIKAHQDIYNALMIDSKKEKELLLTNGVLYERKLSNISVDSHKVEDIPIEKENNMQMNSLELLQENKKIDKVLKIDKEINIKKENIAISNSDNKEKRPIKEKIFVDLDESFLIEKSNDKVDFIVPEDASLIENLDDEVDFVLDKFEQEEADHIDVLEII